MSDQFERSPRDWSLPLSSSQSELQKVQLSGEITVRTIASAHAALVEAFRTSRDVVVDVDIDSNVDLIFVQLLESARRSAREADGTFSLAEPISGGLLEVARRGGFLDTAERRLFWLNTSGDQ